MRDMSDVGYRDMMGLLAVLLVVFYVVKGLKFIMTVCGSDCQKERDFQSSPCC
jgi:hypothetical protein